MIRSLDDLTHYTFEAKDGEIGRVQDLYFDDHAWTVSYLVVDTGRWLPGRTVLLSPQAIEAIDGENHTVRLALDRPLVEKSPPVVADEPVSQQKQKEIHEYYGWRPYWIATPFPLDHPLWRTGRGPKSPAEPSRRARRGDPHLRSVEEVTGYAAECPDGDCGVIDDVACDDADWRVRFMVVDTHRWLPGRKVLIAVEWIREIDWSERKVRVDVARERIRESPPFDPEAPIDRAYEEALYDFHGRPLGGRRVRGEDDV